MAGLVCGVDIGGTFTDCVLIGEDARVAYGKALSSPGDSFQSGFFGSIEAAAEQLGYAGNRTRGAIAPSDASPIEPDSAHRL